MSTDLDRGLRTALEELVNAAPPTDLAVRAIAAGRRRRRWRWGGSVLAGVAAAATIAFTVTAVGGANDPAPVADPPGSHVVLAYWALTDGSPDETYSLVLDRSTGMYKRLPYYVAVPSPDGRHVFVIEDGVVEAVPGDLGFRMGIVDLNTDAVSWLPGDHSNRVAWPWALVQWSPDGSTVLLTDLAPNRDLPAGFTLVDVATLAQTSVTLPLLNVDHQAVLAFSFTPDGDAVMAAHRSVLGLTEETDPVTVSWYTLDGDRIHSRPLGVRAGETVVFTADRTGVLVNGRGDGGEYVASIVSTVDGSVQTIDRDIWAPAVWGDGTIVIAGDQVFGIDGTHLGFVPSPPASATGGRPNQGRWVAIGDATGLPATADHLRF